MTESVNAAATFFAVWFGISIFIAPMIGKVVSIARKRERAVRERMEKQPARPATAPPIRVRGLKSIEG